MPALLRRGKLFNAESEREYTEIMGISGSMLALERSLADAVDQGAHLYRREVMLPRLLPDAIHAAGDNQIEHTKWLCLRLLAALRRERRRGRSGHWSYDFNRHVGLLQAYRAERRHLQELTAGTAKTKSPAEGPGS